MGSDLEFDIWETFLSMAYGLGSVTVNTCFFFTFDLNIRFVYLPDPQYGPSKLLWGNICTILTDILKIMNIYIFYQGP